LIEYYLAHGEERERIAEAGRQEVLAHHTWDHRIAEMLQYLAQCREANGGAE
jgi:spore maturation protein CgeB